VLVLRKNTPKRKIKAKLRVPEVELQQGVISAFVSKGLDTDKALQQIRLADMRQLNLETKEIKLFEFISI